MEENKKFKFTDIFLIITILVLLSIPTYLCYQMFVAKEQIKEMPNIEEIDTTEIPETEEPEVEKGPHYTEVLKGISGQMAYIAIPTNIDEENPPGIVQYHHGSNTKVTSNTSDQFMKDLKKYAELYTSYNLIFAASNAHGENFGNTASMQDNHNMMSWIKKNYKSNGDIYELGFSMGGLTAMRYVKNYPTGIKKVALLAPTSKSSDWNKNNIKILKNIDIKIWHGTKDVNIGITSSRNFVKNMKTLGKTIPLIEINGKTHFDLDTEYMQDVLDFFLGNL